jgi:hypothetical protein
MSDVQVFLYPEELEATTPDALAEQILALGCNAASMAVYYHRARRVFPRQCRVHVLGRATAYFSPSRDRYGTLVPSSLAEPGLRVGVLAFREACARAGISFRSWVVALHDERLAEAHPEARSRTVDGSANGMGLCPSAPEAVEYAASLIADICAQLEPDLVELESAFYPAWEPSYTLTLALEPLPAKAQHLLVQCFCPSCRRLFGGDADTVNKRAIRALEACLTAPRPDEGLLGILAEARARGVAALIDAVADAAHGGGSRLRVFASGSPEQAVLQGLSPRAVEGADRVLLGCGPLAGAEMRTRFEALRELIGGRRATPSLTWTPERTPASIAADVAAVREGSDGLALYNLSLVPERGLAAFRSAAAAFGQGLS